MKRIFLSLVGFSPLRDNLKTEVLAGLTTFATMSYITGTAARHVQSAGKGWISY